MNRVCLVGRLTTKPELRYTNSNLAFSKFTVAVNRIISSEGKKEADFINIVVWRKQAENVCNFLDKGSQVAIEGRIQTGSYDDKDGNKRYTTEVVADSVQFLDTKKKEQEDVTDPYTFTRNRETRDPFSDFGDNVTITNDFLD